MAAGPTDQVGSALPSPPDAGYVHAVLRLLDDDQAATGLPPGTDLRAALSLIIEQQQYLVAHVAHTAELVNELAPLARKIAEGGLGGLLGLLGRK